jgi:hypothetical protein
MGHSKMSDTNTLPKLELPKRWELLVQRADGAGVDPIDVVERVDAAAERVDRLLQRVRTGGGGMFEVVYGLSGSGKTTFLKTLPKFFEGINVTAFPRDRTLTDLPKFIVDAHASAGADARVILIERRDNPSIADLEQVDAMFAELLETFRIPEGRALVLWPITREAAANEIAQKAWETGRDSVTDQATRGIFRFNGLPKERYFEIADSTSRNLAGDPLDAFGITEDVGRGFLGDCETISDFFARLDQHADKIRANTWSILKERVRARLWVVLPGDVLASVESTVKALTAGTRNRIDLDLIGEFIDQPDNKAIYVTEWRKRRAAIAQLLRAIDVRLFPLAPNVALHAVRAFGDASLKNLLKQRSTNFEQSKNAMKASRLYKAILREIGVPTEPYAGGRELGEETSEEYRRIQTVAAKKDTLLNQALGQLIAVCLKDDAPTAKIVTEKRSLPKVELQPDVQIEIGANDYICLEPTWRTTGTPVDAAKEAQNTLTEAHIKKYVLDKADQYIKALGL